MKNTRIQTFEDTKNELLRVNDFVSSLIFESHLETNNLIEYQIEVTRMLLNIIKKVEYLESNSLKQ